MFSHFLLSYIACLFPFSLAQNLTGTIASVPIEYTYNLNSKTFNRNSQDVASWLNTTSVTNNASLTNFLRSAAKANFIAYSDEFYDIFGQSPTLQVLVERNTVLAHDNALWLWDRDELWFSGSLDLQNSTSLSVLDLKTNTVHPLNSSQPITNPSGGCYFNGTVYYTTDGIVPVQTVIQAISVPDLSVQILLDSYFGLRFAAMDDLTWIQKGANSYLYFTADDLRSINAPLFPNSADAHTGRAQLPNAVWMFDPQRQILRPVVSRGQVKLPAFVKSNRQATKLYVGDFSITSFDIHVPGFGPGEEDWGNPAVWSYTIADDGTLHNAQIFSLAGDGAANGFHLDDEGRVWTAETDGIYIRDENGRVIGVVNAAPLLEGGDAIASVIDFALAGDELIVLADTRIWSIQLAQTVVDPASWMAGL